jgi:hypothetical protein
MYNNHISTKGYKMPNWVYNGLTIEGNPEQVEQLVTQMNTPFEDDIEPTGDLSFGIKKSVYSKPIFAFRNIIGPTDLIAYQEQPVRSDLPSSDPNWWADLTEKSKTDNSWYSFNNREWGTKWDVAVSDDNEYPETYMEGPVVNGENKVVYYTFNTAWSPPIQAIEKLSAQYPTLLFTLSYREETDWGGEMEILRGSIISQSEYENQCNDCDSIDTMEYCENECGQICSSCNYLGEADLENVELCQTHKIYLDTNVPEYRKVES